MGGCVDEVVGPFLCPEGSCSFCDAGGVCLDASARADRWAGSGWASVAAAPCVQLAAGHRCRLAELLLLVGGAS